MIRSVRAPLTTALVTLAIGVGMALRTVGLHRGLWLDEYTTLLQLDPHDTLNTLARVRLDTHHPLYFLLLGLWSKVSTSLPWLRLLSVLIDLGTMLTLWFWLRRISPRGALMAVGYMATAPLFVRFGLELRPSGLLTCTTALSMWATQAILEQRSPRRWSLWSLAVTALVATHPVGIMFVPALAAWIVMQTKNAHWRALTAALVAPVSMFALLHWVYQALPTLAAISWMPHISWELLGNTAQYLTGSPQANMPQWLRALAAAVLSVWFIALLSNVRSRAWPMALWGLTFVALVTAYSFFGTPIFWYRQLMPAVLCLGIFLALHTAALPEGWRNAAGTGAMVLLCALQTWQTIQSLGIPVEPSPEVGTVLHREWSPHSVALYYPDYLGASVRAEAEGIPSGKIYSLEDTAEPPNGAFTDNVFVAVRVDLGVAQAPDLLAKQLQRRLRQIPGAHDVQLMLVPSHDLDVMDKAYAVGDVVHAISKRLGAPTALPQQGALERWQYRVVR